MYKRQDLGSDLCDFLKAHIEKFTESDDIKNCQFSDSSDIMPIIRDCTPENFVDSSKLLCEKLFQIMNSNIDIPPADVAVMVFSVKSCDYLAILKLNYRTSYTHTTRPVSYTHLDVYKRQTFPSVSQIQKSIRVIPFNPSIVV